MAISVWLVPGIALPQDCSLTFSVPEGWLDLSPGAPAENFERAPEGYAEQARSGMLEAFAIRPSRYGDVDVFAAAVWKGRPAFLNEGALDWMAGKIAQDLARPDNPMKIIEKSLVEIDGVQAGRVLLGNPSVTGTRGLVYFVPGDRCTGVLVYNTSATSLRELGDTLDASAMRTKGAVQPPNPGLLFALLTNPERAGKVLLLVFIVVVGVVVVGLYLKTRRASTPRRLPPRPYRPR